MWTWASTISMARPPRTASRLHLEVLGRRGIGVALDQAGAGLLDAGPDAAQEGLLEDGRGQHAIRDRLLQLVQQRLPLLPVQLLRLALEQVLEIGEGPVRVDPVLRHEGFESSG